MRYSKNMNRPPLTYSLIRGQIPNVREIKVSGLSHASYETDYPILSYVVKGEILQQQEHETERGRTPRKVILDVDLKKNQDAYKRLRTKIEAAYIDATYRGRR